MVSSKLPLILAAFACLVDRAGAAPAPPSTKAATTATIIADALRSIGSFEIPHPSFLGFYPSRDNASQNDLWITEFSAFKSGKVARVDYEGIRSPSTATPVTLDMDFIWPNVIEFAPQGALGDAAVDDRFLVVPDGFLVPGKATGAISIVANPSLPTANKTKISTDIKNYFYHRVLWKDMNDDGKLDILTARVQKETFSIKNGQLVWFEQPQSTPLSVGAWKEHVITSGPDVFICQIELPNTDGFQVFAAQFFTNVVKMYNIVNGSVTFERVVDELSAPEQCDIVELNGDGEQQLMCNSHVDVKGIGGSVIAYEFPADIQNGTFNKHVLVTNFTVDERGFNQAAPGITTLFHPQAPSAPTDMPWLVVAGDGAQTATLAVPTGKWTYNTSVIIDTHGTVGNIAAGDVDEDGWAEIFVPDYDSGKVFAYTFSPVN